uniref:ZAD domain-containing protein n=1 Tax=Megaselia scalaris TaxID=36166 RepID=T1GGY9_MEGSC
MPQNCCTLCSDKIDDFFEFREMCYATNAQTRKLLGLRELKPKPETKSEIIVPVKADTPPPPPSPSPPSPIPVITTRKRKNQQNLVVEKEEVVVPTKQSKKDLKIAK